MSPTPSEQPESLLSRHRVLSPSASLRVSPLCLGTMTFGTAHAERYGEMDKATAFKILDTFYANGGNFIDTANGYRDGESERWIGEWLADRGVRDEMVIATKYTSFFGFDKKIKSNHVGNGTKSMTLSLEQSLKQLGTSYVDIFYVHWWDYATSIPELMHSLNTLVVSGKVLYLGISDCPAWVASSANQYARCNGLRPFSIYQGMWNAAMRDFERDIIPMCAAEGMALAPYGVLGQGHFQTKKAYEERAKHNPGRNFMAIKPRDRAVSAIFEKMAESKSCSLYNIALAYCSQKVPYVFPVVGGRKVEHIQDSIDGLKVSLTEEEIAEIESAYEFDHGFPHTFLSGSLFEPLDTKPRMAQHAGDVWLTKLGGTFDYIESPKAIRPAERK